MTSPSDPLLPCMLVRCCCSWVVKGCNCRSELTSYRDAALNLKVRFIFSTLSIGSCFDGALRRMGCICVWRPSVNIIDKLTNHRGPSVRVAKRVVGYNIHFEISGALCFPAQLRSFSILGDSLLPFPIASAPSQSRPRVQRFGGDPAPGWLLAHACRFGERDVSNIDYGV